jgi:hypothetical protein
VSAGDFLGIEDELRALVRASTGGDVADVARLAGGGLAHRRFYRVTLRNGEPATLIARADRGEPAPGVLPEPALEPLRSFLEAHGLPVPRRFGDAARGLGLLEISATLAHTGARVGRHGGSARSTKNCALVPRCGSPTRAAPAFERALDATLFA